MLADLIPQLVHAALVLAFLGGAAMAGLYGFVVWGEGTRR